MSNKWRAEEVLRVANSIWHHTVGATSSHEHRLKLAEQMLTAYAKRIEADERAVTDEVVEQGDAIGSGECKTMSDAVRLANKARWPDDEDIFWVPETCYLAAIAEIQWLEALLYPAIAAQPHAVPDGWRRALERAVPFLDDEASKYEDDGNNEPLDVANTIRDLLAAAPSPGEP